VRDIEARVLGVPTGEQDHYPAVYGGVSAIHLGPVGTWREALPVRTEELESRLVLVYTGKPRKSGINNWEVLKNYIDGNRALRRNFEEIAAAAREMRAALLKPDWRAGAEAMERDAAARRRNAPTIETPFIRKLAAAGRRHGALAAKVCGAGGGGCVAFLCEPKRRGKVAQALASAGATLLPFRVAMSGVRVRKE
jgi:D-glycero-alpha-D-manno-heptose-7-phosphate kinase